MKKITQWVLATILLIGSTSFLLVEKNQPAPTQMATENNNWFHTISVPDGITVEFEYGSQLQVFIQGDINNIALELRNYVLTATTKTKKSSLKGTTIKVITPVLISLSASQGATSLRCINQKGICRAAGGAMLLNSVTPKQKIFQVFTQNT